MEYIDLAFNVRDSYQDRKIMLVYISDTARHKAVSLANDSGRYEKIRSNGVNYDIVSKTSGIINIVSVGPNFAGSWNEVTDIWYDDSIPKEQISKLEKDVTRNMLHGRDSIVTIPFSMIRSTYALDENIPVEEDVCLEEYLSELFSGSSSKEVRV